MELDVTNTEVMSQEKITAKIEYVDSSLSTYSFSEMISNTNVSFSVLKLKDSLFLWIGSGTEPRMVNLSLAMKSPYDSLPLTTQILGPRTNDYSSGLAAQLTTLLKKPVYVSLNIDLQQFLFAELTKRLKEEIKNKPEYF